MVQRTWNAIAGAILAATLIGLGEAAVVLQTSASGEMGALPYAAVLYALIGLCMGAAIGVGAAVLGKLWKGMPEGLGWGLGFGGVSASLGVVIALYVANKAVYAEQGVPGSAKLAILGGAVVIALIAIGVGWRFMGGPLSFFRKPLGLGATWGILAAGAFGAHATVDMDALNGDRVPAKAAEGALADKPHVVLVVMDTLRSDYLGTYGNPDGLSPNIDAMSEDAVVFEQLVTHASWTRASFASLYSSMLPSSHKCATKVSTLPDDVITLAEALSDHGYATAGLPNNINVTRSFNFDQGYDYFNYQAPSYIAGATESASQLSMYNVVRKLRDKVMGSNKSVSDYYQPAEVVLPTALSWIEDNHAAGNRGFIMAHLMEAHDPYFRHPYDGYAVGRAWHPDPDPSEADELKALYRDEIKHADQELGKFIQQLKDKGLYEDTLIILTADHGEEFHEHGGWWHGVTLYDEQVHVPLIVKLPGNERAGQRVSWQVRQLDITPTIATMAGAPHPDLWQGHDLFEARTLAALDQLHGVAPPADGGEETEGSADAAAPDAETAEAAAGGAAAAAVPSGPDLEALERVAVSEQDFEGNVLAAIRADGWKYIEANEGNPRGLATQELYDITEDPTEQDNLAGSQDGKADAMAQAMRDTIEAAATGGVEATTDELTCEDCNRLMMLGYMSDCTEACGG